MLDFRGAKRKRCVSYFTLRWCPKNARWPKTLCELAIVWVWARRTIKIAYCFDQNNYLVRLVNNNNNNNFILDACRGTPARAITSGLIAITTR